MTRTFFAGTAGLLALFLVILIMTGVANQAQGPPGGLDVRVTNAPTEPVPVTRSLGVSGTATVEVTNIPEVQSVEIVNGPQLTGERLKFSLESGSDEDDDSLSPR